tara:strand:+ start:6201 stop:7187 length:987 start_codon:yes stop_codon:yes gene_type:complete
MVAVKAKCIKQLEKIMQGESGFGVRYVDIDEQEGQRIDNFLLALLSGVPRSRVYRLLRKGEVRVNGGRVKATYRLKRADRVRVPPVRTKARAEPARPSQAAARALESALLFEDEALIALNKPAGMAVHGGSGISYGLIEALRAMRPGAFLELAHRLDRDTSGCLVVAKTPGALRQLHAVLRKREAKKAYVAIVHERWPAKLTTVRLSLHKYVTASGERRVRVSSQGKPSRTDFQRVADAKRATRLHAFPHTGRTHQIRVHTAASGHAVFGDDKYCDEQGLDLSRDLGIRALCLHAHKLSFSCAGDEYRFSAPTPEAFESAWEALVQDG